jgi:hypothetical protein
MHGTHALRPVHEISLGAVRASIWFDDDAARYVVTVSRFRAIGGTFAARNCFEVDDLPVLAEAMDLAHHWIFAQAEMIA